MYVYNKIQYNMYVRNMYVYIYNTIKNTIQYNAICMYIINIKYNTICMYIIQHNRYVYNTISIIQYNTIPIYNTIQFAFYFIVYSMYVYNTAQYVYKNFFMYTIQCNTICMYTTIQFFYWMYV